MATAASPNKTTDAKIYRHADQDGQFRRQTSRFRSSVSSSAEAEFPAEANRYVLYVNLLCPWAHRTNIVLHLKGLTELVRVVVLDYELAPDGWFFSGRGGSAPEDPLYGFKQLKQLYLKADPGYDQRYTVPMLWDSRRETVVNNESSEIMRMFYTEFDQLLPEHVREPSRPGGGLLPARLRRQMDEMNGWVYDAVNNGVYKTGFATTQEAYESHVYALFDGLDRLERHLGESAHQPYLFGEHITEADVRLYTTLIRFDAAYHTMFKCNVRMIRHDYPRLHAWLRRLYWDESDETNGGAFGSSTTNFEHIKKGYPTALRDRIVPAGPVPDILPLD